MTLTLRPVPRKLRSIHEIDVRNVGPEPPTDRKCDDGLFSGNPILPATAEKYRSEIDWTDSGPAALSLERIYRSNWTSYVARPATGLGAAWTHTRLPRGS